MSEWKKYRKTAVQEMRDYVFNEDLTGISVAPGETPKIGGKIARDNQGSQWYVSPEFIQENYVLADTPKGSDADLFVEHIKGHLQPNQKVVCKICGLSIGEAAARMRHPENY